MTSRPLHAVLPWLPAAGITIYAKALLMHQSGVCYDCFALGRQSLWDKIGELSFFRADLLVGLLLVPAALVVLDRFCRLSRIAAAAASTAVLLLVTLQLECLLNVGAFVSADLLRDALVWGWHNQTEGRAYVPVPTLALLAVGLAATWFATLLRFPRLPPRIGAGLVLAAALAVAGAWLLPAPDSPVHSSVLRLAVAPAAQWKPDDTTALDHLSADALVARYRRLAGAPTSARDPRYWASHAGSDVIFFIYETAPARCLPIDGDLTDLPALARLRERAFIATRHLATAPITRLATLSLLNSLYPPTAGFQTLEAIPARPWPGLPTALAAAGYDTAVYSPYDPGMHIPYYNEQLNAQGLRRIVYAPPSLFRDQPNGPRNKELHLAEDREAVRLLQADIGRHAGRDQRYLAAFTPIIGHAPWWDPTNGKIPNLWDRGRALLRLQDRMLAGIIADLERHNRLDDTVIVVTSDHGIRTRSEDPDFPVGWVDAISYHVPLLIWAPRAVKQTVAIDHYTSHLDVAPAVADLLGLESGREFEQGAPIWDPRIAERSTYYLGRFTFGADAMRHNGQFIMYRHMTNTTYRSPTLHFQRPDTEPDSDAINLLARFSPLQRTLLNRPLTSPSATPTPSPAESPSSPSSP